MLKTSILNKFVMGLIALGFIGNQAMAEPITRILIAKTRSDNGNSYIALKSTISEDERIVFESCQAWSRVDSGSQEARFNVNGCTAIGSPQGYTRAELQERITELKSKSRNEKIWNFVALTSGAVIGGGIGFVSPYAIDLVAKFTQVQFAAATIVGTVAGAGAGAGLAGYLFWGNEYNGQAPTLEKALESTSSSAEILELDSKDLNIVLSGLGKTLVGINK